ncbi:MAG: hypothetical protein JO128_01370, partial [Alphaproteobacteria bacterium]|nr:hypothetical protein [Alphaproteobacteria bacterium]
MTTVATTSGLAKPRVSGTTAALIVLLPIALLLVCFLARVGIIDISHTTRA